MLIRDRELWRTFQCPHWPYWELYGDSSRRRPLTEEKELVLMGRLDAEAALVRSDAPGAVTIRTQEPIAAFKRTLQYMRKGVHAIYHPVLFVDDREARPTLLLRVEEKSDLGDWQYVAVRIKRAHYLRKEDQLIGTFDALLLERIQGVRPVRSWQWSGDHERFEILVEPLAQECRDLEVTIERALEGERPATTFRKSCLDTSPWRTLCTALAESNNDIALISDVDRKKLEALRAAGVLSVSDMVARDPLTLIGTSPVLTPRAVEKIQLQAKSLQEGSVIIRKPFVDPSKGLEIHFDIESYPAADRDYLFGFLICKPNGTTKVKSFVAKRPSGEKAMWKRFMRWLESLPESYTIFHYSPYEQERIKLLATRYGDEGRASVEQFLASCVDLKEYVRETSILPLRVYSLKSIARFLGFQWQGEVHDGGESVDVYARWLAEHNLKDLEDLCAYNADDTRATRVLLAWLRAYATEETIYPAGTIWTGLSRILV